MKHAITLLLASAALSCSQLYAADAYFSGTLGGDGLVTTNNYNAAGNWQNFDKAPFGSVPSSSDNIFIDGSYLTWGSGNTRLFITSNTSGGKLTFQNTNSGSTAKAIQVAINGTYDLTFTGIDYIKNAYSGDVILGIPVVADKQGTITVNGDVNGGKAGDTGTKGALQFGAGGDQHWSGWGGPSKLTVNGDVNLYGTNCNFNVGVGSKDGKSGNATYDNADITISGVMRLVNANAINPKVILNQRGSGAYNGLRTENILNAVIAIGGLSGDGIITNNTTNATDKWGKGSSTLVLNNAAGSSYEFKGYVKDDENKIAIAGVETVTKLVMRGQGTQIFSNGTTLIFTGGVEVLAGTLQLNYGTQTNHGDLLVSGGKFMNYTGATVKNVNFTNFIVNGGTIGSRWDGTALDVITLSAAFKKGDAFGAGDKLFFEITGDLTALIDVEQKLVSWDNKNFVTDLTSDDFAATSLEGYEAIFSIKDDGLYISYVIPEPAVFAAFLGVLALGLVLRRKVRG